MPTPFILNDVFVWLPFTKHKNQFDWKNTHDDAIFRRLSISIIITLLAA